MTSIITNEIEERYPYPDNGERPTGITRLGQCLASRKAYRAGVCRKITDREIDMAALAVYTGTSGMGFEEVEPLWSKLNPDAKEQYRRLARLAITAARTEALKWANSNGSKYAGSSRIRSASPARSSSSTTAAGSTKPPRAVRTWTT